MTGTSTDDTQRITWSGPLAVLLLSSTLAVMAGASISPVLALIQDDLGLSNTAAGFVLTTHGLTMALAGPLVGRAIDRWGVRLPLVVGLLLYGLGGGAGLIAGGFGWLIASRVVLGLGAAIVFTGTLTGLLRLYTGSKRDRVMGWQTTATTAGGIVWPLLAGTLGQVSWHGAFAVYLIGLPLGLAALAVLPKTRQPVTDGDGAEGGPGVIALLRRAPTLLPLYFVTLASGLMLYVPAVFLPQRLAQIGITSTVLVALYAITVGAITASLMGLSYQRLRTRTSPLSLLQAAALSWVVAYGLYGLVDTPAVLLVASALLGVGNGLAMPSLTIMIGGLVTDEGYGRATSLQGTAMFAGQFISPLLAGPLITATSYATGFLAAAVVAATVLVALLVGRPGADIGRRQAVDDSPVDDAATTPVPNASEEPKALTSISSDHIQRDRTRT